MARCSDCNRFVSYDDPPECEGEGVEISGDTITTNVTVNLCCADCGSPLRTASIEAEETIHHTCTPGSKPDEDYSQGDEQYALESEGDLDGESRRQTTDRRGRSIKNSRYQRTYYGFRQTVQVRCRRCRLTFDVELAGEEQASAFDEA